MSDANISPQSLGIKESFLSLIQSVRLKMSCQNFRSECTEQQQDKNKGAGFFEDEPVTLPPGSVPETYRFKCPGDMCSPENSSHLQTPEKQRIRLMTKTYCSSSSGECTKTPNNCDIAMDKDKKQNFEDVIPPITTKIPDTASFKCPGPGCGDEKGSADCGKSGGKNADTCNNNSSKKCGCGPIPGKRCNCPRTPPPHSQKPAGCNCKDGVCEPNTSCEVLPLSMKRK